LEVKDTKNALLQYQELESHGVKSRDVRLGLARCYLAEGQGDKAGEILEQLVQDYPESWEVWSERGKLAVQAKDWAKAEDYFRKAVAIHPYEPGSLFSLYYCLRRQGGPKRREAEKWHARYNKLTRDAKRLGELILKITNDHVNDPAVLFEAGNLYMEMGQEEAGVYWLHRVLQVQRQHRGARKVLAAYYEKIGRSDLATQYK
jgi:Flp pilus assembly protein TadD